MTVGRTELRSLYVARQTQSQALRLAKTSGTAARITTDAAGSTTQLSTPLTVTANTYRGNLIEVLSGANKGHRAICLAQTATGTITTEAFDNSNGSGVEFRILDNTIPVFIEDGSGGGQTSIVDATRSATYEGDNFWVGDFARCLKATNITVGKMTEISAYTGATGTLTVGALGANVSDGDVYAIERCIPFEGGSFTPGTVTQDRPAVRGTFAPLPPAVGGRSQGELTFSIPVNGDDTGAGNGVAWTRQSVIMPLLEACMGTATLDTGSVVGTTVASTTVSLKIKSGTGEENFTVGNMVMVNGEATRITAITDGDSAQDTLTVSPALSAVPNPATVVYASATFKRATSGHSGLSFTFYDDQVRHRMYASLGTVSFATDANGRILASFTFHSQAHDHAAQTDPVSLDGTHTPDTAVADIMGIDGTINVNGDKVHCGSVSFDPGIVEAERSSNGAVEGNLGRSVRGGAAKFTANPLLENVTYYDDFYQGDALNPGPLWQSGNEPGNTFVCFAPQGHIETAPNSEDSEGELRQALSVRVTQPASTEPTQDDIIFALM